jgi:hypothetical protein
LSGKKKIKKKESWTLEASSFFEEEAVGGRD